MNDDLHTLSGAYAVHALPYAEWVLFEEHLRACPACGDEVRHLRETAARLAETVAQPPPAVLRDRLLAAAHRVRRDERQEPVPDDSPTLSLPPEPGRGPRLRPIPGIGQAPGTGQVPGTGQISGTGQVGGTGQAVGTGQVGGTGQVVPLRRGRSKVLAGLAAVSTAAAIALGAVAFDARRDLGDLTARNDQVVAVLAAPDVTTVRQPVTSGGSATVVVSRSQGRMVFTSSNLPALPDDQGYELWLMGPDGPRPAGMLASAEGGVTAPVLLAPLKEDDKVALTVEPAAGSEKPTTQPVMLADLPET